MSKSQSAMNGSRIFCKLGHADRDESKCTGFHLTKPQIVAIVENDGTQMKAAEKMMYFKMPQRRDYPLDLMAGYEDYEHRSVNYYKYKLNKVGYYLMHQDEFDDKDDDDANPGRLPRNLRELEDEEDAGEEDVEIITHRGVLSIVMRTPYHAESRFGLKWRICATKYNNRLYLAECDYSPLNQHYGQFQASPVQTFHFKFQQYCFVEDPNVEPETKIPVNEEKQLYGIFRSKLKDLSIIYSAELSGIESAKKLDNLKDMKTLRQCRFVDARLTKDVAFKRRHVPPTLDWWAKAHLGGVEAIYIGARNSEDLVKKPIKHVTVSELDQNQPWKPCVCVKFLHTFLKKVLEEMRGVDCPYTCYEFIFEPNMELIKLRIHDGNTEYKVLSPDFIEFLTAN